jgi:hypothetical protein
MDFGVRNWSRLLSEGLGVALGVLFLYQGVNSLTRSHREPENS